MTRKTTETLIVRIVETIESDDAPPSPRSPRKCGPKLIVETTGEPVTDNVVELAARRSA